MDAILDNYSDAEDDDSVSTPTRRPAKRKQNGPELMSAYGGKKLKQKMSAEYSDDLEALQLMEARELRAWSHALDQRIVAIGRLLFQPGSGPRSAFRDDELERVSRQSAELERAIIQYFRKTYPEPILPIVQQAAA